MAIYNYRAKSREQQLITGNIEASNLEAAAEQLLSKGLSILHLQEYHPPFWAQSWRPLRHVKTRDLVIFFRQLSVLISASVPIVQALKMLTGQIASPHLREAVTELANDVDGGAKLSASMGKYPHIFSILHRSLIQTGETSGKLDSILEYLATQEERNYDLTSRIKGAMAYPAVVITLLLGVSIFVVTYIIPQLTEILTQTGAELPLATRILLGISEGIKNYWWLIILVLLALVTAAVAAWRTPYGRWQIDHFFLKLPVIGQLVQRVYVVRICRSMQTLIVGGVHVTRALAIISGVVGSPIYKQMIEATIREVEDGNSITTVMSRSPFIPAMVPQMMAVGEQTGKLDEILEKISEFYSREIDNLVRSLISLLEPLIIIVIAVGIGFLLVAVLMPIYNSTAAV